MTPDYFPASLQNIFAVILHHHRLPEKKSAVNPKRMKGAQEE
jgi:hypothetical protein